MRDQRVFDVGCGLLAPNNTCTDFKFQMEFLDNSLTWSKAMSPSPERVKVVVGWLREIVVVLADRGDCGDEADVVPLLHPTVAGRRLVISKGVAIIT